MELSLSSHWNACRHGTGEALIEEILRLGFRRVELGYDLTLDLVPGVLKMVADKAVTVETVHNFCPVPVGAPQGHPELFDLSSPDPRQRESAVRHTVKTLDFAAQIGARVTITHAGNVDMKRYTPALIELCESGRQYTPKFDRIKGKLMTQRDEKARKHLDALARSIEELLPILAANRVTLALENLPSWESLPTEVELEGLLRRFDSPNLAYWHDIGHGQIRQNLGFISVERWLERLGPRTAGMHVHDVGPFVRDHLMPPKGTIDFSQFTPHLRPGMALVLEPAPMTPEADITAARDLLTGLWAPTLASQPEQGASS